MCLCILYIFAFFTSQSTVSQWDCRRCALLTNNCWISHHVFVRHFIQQAENWPEYLPASPLLLVRECRPNSSDCFWQWQQEQAVWEDFFEDLLLNLYRGVRRMSPMEKEFVFLYELICEFSWTSRLKLGYHLKSNAGCCFSLGAVWYSTVLDDYSGLLHWN